MDKGRVDQLLQYAYKKIWSDFRDLIQKHGDDPEWLLELEAYIDDTTKSSYKWDLNKAKTIFQILENRSDDTISNVLAYLKQTEYGWQGSQYHLYNRCLSRASHCRRSYPLKNEELVKRAIMTVKSVFLDENFGGITTYLFGYSLVALFSSRLSQDDVRIPYFLQIACEKNSNVYKLIHEIVHICDINTGLVRNCNEAIGAKYGCTYDHITLFPTQATGSSLDNLAYNRDLPVVIDGFEHEGYYNTLLRETANIPGKIKNLDIKSRFNTLPIFLCPVIRSQYRNIFSMDLTEFEVSDEYLELIQESRQMLGAWAFALVTGAEEHIFYTLPPEEEAVFKATGKRHYFRNINGYINSHKVKLDLSGNDTTNIGLLSYFLRKYIEVIDRAFRMNPDVIEYLRGLNPSDFLNKMLENMENSLVRLHKDYSPLAQTAVAIETGDVKHENLLKIKRVGEKYAKDIVKHYQSYGVAIRILPKAQFKDERYVFSIGLIPGTDGRLINRYSDSVRRLLDVETFYIEKTTKEIRIIVSKKALNENSLEKILESSEFWDNKMDIPYAVGYDIMGEMVITDISQFPHLLIGGTSGSGKSSAIHSILTSIVVKQPPEKVKLLLLDFGASRMTIFKKAPHLLVPVIKSSEIGKARKAILWLQKLMEERLKKKDSLDDRKHDGELAKWPSIICVIDEFPSFIRQLNDGRGNKDSHKIIEDLLERARKVKIHLILAAQDATKGNIAIKNTNLAAGIAFKCTNWSASKAIIDDTAATELSGKGAMYFRCDQHEGLKRLQGSFMDPLEIMELIENYDFGSIEADRQYYAVHLNAFQENIGGKVAVTSFDTKVQQYDETLIEIVRWVLNKEKISNKNLKEHFEMGFDRAKLYMSQLEELGIVTEQKAKLPRAVIHDKVQDFLKEHDNLAEIPGDV